MEMQGSKRDWAGLVVDILECISGRLTNPKDFVRFRAVCPQWRASIPITHARFPPWILKTDEIGGSGNILFYSLGSDKFLEMHVPALEGRTTRLAGSGAGLLIGVDCGDELSAMLVNPLTVDSAVLPRLPEWCRGSITCGFITDPKATGEEDAFVVVYTWWLLAGQERPDLVALWRCGGDAAATGWTMVPSQRFWQMMPEHRKNFPNIVSQDHELAGASAAGGGKLTLVPGLESKHLIEHEGQVRSLSRHEIYTASLPRVTFELHEVLGGNWAPVDWDDHAPELRDKIILQSRGEPLYYVLQASGDLLGLGLSKNCNCFLSHLSVAGQGCYLCKWDLRDRVLTVVKQIPGVWEWVPGKWFLPTLRKYNAASRRESLGHGILLFALLFGSHFMPSLSRM